MLSDQYTGLIMGAMTLMSGIGVFAAPIIVSKFGRLKANTAVFISLCILYITMAFISGFLYLFLVIITAMMQYMMGGIY